MKVKWNNQEVVDDARLYVMLFIIETSYFQPVLL